MNIGNYGQYSSSNYGAHTRYIETPAGTVYYSYNTPVAVSWSGGRLVSVNNWGVTTGKHLNWIDGGNKKDRVSHDTVLAKIAELGL